MKIAERDAFAIHESVIKTEEELLLFTLFSFKASLTYDLLGFVSGMDTANAKRYQDRGIAVLQEALATSGYLPKRVFANVVEFKAYFKQYETLLIGATEQRVQRPQDYTTQKEWYSGKKAHTLKGVVISTKTRRISFLSRFQSGKQHDHRLLKKFFSLDKQ